MSQWEMTVNLFCLNATNHPLTLEILPDVNDTTYHRERL